MSALTVPLDTVLAGQPRAFSARAVPSSIAARRPLSGRITVSRQGIEGDAVGDPSVHGGADKAIHYYPREHYADFAIDDPSLAPLLSEAGAFGENLSGFGLTEDTACLGDVYAWGPTVRLQLSHGRSPCWKLNARFGVPDMLQRVLSTGRTGWYFRVLAAGAVEAPSALTLLERPHPTWSVRRAVRVLLVERADPVALADLAAMEILAEAWRTAAAARVARLRG